MEKIFGPTFGQLGLTYYYHFTK